MMVLQNLLGNADDAIDRITGTSTQADQSGVAFSREFNVKDFDSFGGKVTPGKMVEFGRFQVGANVEYSWGFGVAENPENQGYIYIDLQSPNGNPVEGTLQLAVETSTNRETIPVKEFDTTKLDASKTDRRKQIPVPEQVQSALATQDAYLILRLDASSDNTDQEISSDKSEVIIPATEYDLTVQR